jgi:uncharacterized protein with PIN domain
LTRFLVDAMLGKLARYLRMCGHDAAYALDRGVEDDDALADVARVEDRTLLTRDRSLAGRVDDAILLGEREVADQLRELRAAGVDVSLADRPTRCGACNGELGALSPDAESPAYAPAPDEVTVWRCRRCGQCFWKGSHWDDVAARLADL